MLTSAVLRATRCAGLLPRQRGTVPWVAGAASRRAAPCASTRNASSLASPSRAATWNALRAFGIVGTGITLTATLMRAAWEARSAAPEESAATRSLVVIASADETPTVQIQHESGEARTHKLAPIPTRIAANLIDGCYAILRMCFGFALTLSLTLLTVGRDAVDFDSTLLANEQPVSFVIGLCGALLTMIYSVFKPGANMIALNGQTTGMKAMGIRKMKLDGGKIDSKVLVLESFGRWIEAPIAMGSLVLALFTDKQQCLHNIIAGTVVFLDERAEERESHDLSPVHARNSDNLKKSHQAAW
jgi:uncharacterized RDD family membrane protein YckC